MILQDVKILINLPHYFDNSKKNSNFAINKLVS